MSLCVVYLKDKDFCMMITCLVQSKFCFNDFFHLKLIIIRFFYRTKETLASGNLLSVINVLMQLRKVCNHPNLFEVRPTISPFQCDGIRLHIPSIVYTALDYDPFKVSYLIFLQPFKNTQSLSNGDIA